MNGSSLDGKFKEHSVLRYLERVHGIDMDEIRAEMLADLETADVDPSPARKGRFKFRTEKAIYYVTKEGVVVTVLDATWKP